MSEKNMNGNECLERELNSMAAEVPEMPASFREGWRRAIREEAAAQTLFAENSTNKKMDEKKESVSELTESKKRVSLLRTRRWTGILSAAAVMVFLIGGTLATRGTLSPRLRKNADILMPGSGSVQNEEKTWSVDGGVKQNSEEQGHTESIGSENSAERAMGISLGMSMEAQETAFPTGIPEEMETEKNGRMEDAVFFEADYEEIAPEAGKAGMKAEVLTDAAGSAGIPSAEENAAEAVMPFTAVESEKTLLAEKEMDSAEEAEFSGFWTQVSWFLEDMGVFLLAAFPYLLCTAAVTVILLLIMRNRKH